ncbi:MAG: hypothetical protein WCV56_01015 [Candidatus Omnitrophota bacterium]
MVKRLIAEEQVVKLKKKAQAKKDIKTAITKIKNTCGLTAKELKAFVFLFTDKDENGAA